MENENDSTILLWGYLEELFFDSRRLYSDVIIVFL